MSSQEQDKQRVIVDQLTNMPDVKDSRSKEEIYHQISSRLSQEVKTGGRKRWLPFVSAIAAALLFFILLPVLLHMDMQQTIEEHSPNQTNNLQIQDNQASPYSQENSRQETMADHDSSGQESSLEKPDDESLVVRSVGQDENIYFAGIPDIQEQYVIPFAFIHAGERDLQRFYNNMDQYISELDHFTGTYMFANAEFTFKQSESEVALALPDDFSIEGSTAAKNIFEHILTAMFSPYGTEIVTLHTNDGKPAVLEPFDVIGELSLPDMIPASYKLYEPDDSKMLIPIPNDEQTGIEEAIQKMKEDEKEFHIYRTIPDDIQFTIEKENTHLNFILTDDTDFKEDRRSVDMIEAVLMTAKSYGYEQVKFDNTDIEHLGPYNLTEPVPVPEAVNPVYLDD
jgi:hypothetical protein